MAAAGHRSAGSDGHAPERTCIVSRSRASPGGLIRFVVAPDGAVVADLAGTLPGRGAWVGGHKSLVAKAAAKGAFARAFRREVGIAPDLPELVEKLLTKRAVQALSLANKAGLAVAGHDKVEAAIGAGHVRALIHAADGSAQNVERLVRKYLASCRAAERPPCVLDGLSSEQLGLAFGRTSVVHAAVSPGRTADGFVEAVERLKHYRQPPQQISDDAPIDADSAASRAPRRNAGPETERA